MRKQEETNYEVIIVGAGPSGLAAALTLLEEGISDVIVIERFKFPRYKCCAGYITGKTKAVYETFGLNIEEAHYSLIKEFNIFYRLKKRQTILNKFLYTNRMIDRVELDNTFAELAKSKGSLFSRTLRQRKFRFISALRNVGTAGSALTGALRMSD